MRGGWDLAATTVLGPNLCPSFGCGIWGPWLHSLAPSSPYLVLNAAKKVYRGQKALLSWLGFQPQFPRRSEVPVWTAEEEGLGMRYKTVPSAHMPGQEKSKGRLSPGALPAAPR